MAIPELELRRAAKCLDSFCDRVRPEVRNQLQFLWRVRGKQITLLERRPAYRRPGEFTERPFARFQFDPEIHHWTLKWSDRNGRFHVYEGLESVRSFERLVHEVGSDPTGIFLG